MQNGRMVCSNYSFTKDKTAPKVLPSGLVAESCKTDVYSKSKYKNRIVQAKAERIASPIR